MLHIHSFTFNPFQENTFLIINEQKLCWIVDPGMYDVQETNQLVKYITDNDLKPQAIINTHTHIDHIFGVQALIDKYQIPFGVNEKDMPVLKNAAGSAMLFGLNFGKAPEPTFFIPDSGKMDLGGDEIEIRFTPGHSPGSVVFYYAQGSWLIGGDVLFSGGIDGTDLPSGNFETLINSIKNELFTLPDGTTVHCGHGPSTTIRNEKEYNPFLN